MKRPQISTLLFGHPLVATPLLLADGAFGAFYAMNDGLDVVVIASLAIGLWLADCCRQAARYRAWDALDPDHPPRKTLGQIARRAIEVVVGLPLLCGAGWLLLNFRDPQSAAHSVAPLAILVVISVVLAKWMWGRRRHLPKAPKLALVTQAIARPLSAPSVAQAYAVLPDYCRALLPTSILERTRDVV
jgi:hypothetical protein